MKDALTVAGSALVVAVFAACAPTLLVPAEGTSLGYRICGQTSQGVLVSAYEAPCPDLACVSERVRRVRETYRGCAFDGVRIYVVGAYVQCDGDTTHGCTFGDQITVQGDPAAMATIEHELRHVCISQVEGANSWGHYDLDHRREQIDAILHPNEPAEVH